MGYVDDELIAFKSDRVAPCCVTHHLSSICIRGHGPSEQATPSNECPDSKLNVDKVRHVDEYSWGFRPGSTVGRKYLSAH